MNKLLNIYAAKISRTGTKEVKEPLSLKSEIFKDVTKSNIKL